eukprot:336240-Pelagomonas_calceolata.AAC.6
MRLFPGPSEHHNPLVLPRAWPPRTRSALRPRRAAAQKSYQGLASENEDDDIEMDEEDEEGEEGRGQGRPIAGAARAIRPLQHNVLPPPKADESANRVFILHHDPIEILSTEDPDEAKEQGRDRQGGRGSLDLEADEVKRPNPRKRAAAPKRTLKGGSLQGTSLPRVWVAIRLQNTALVLTEVSTGVVVFMRLQFSQVTGL